MKLQGLLLALAAVGRVAAQPTQAMVEPVEYSDPYDGDFPLKGYISFPEAETAAPAVVIVPDWTGADEYEQIRATMLRDMGYVGFVADIFGPDLQGIEDQPTQIEQAVKYRSNNTLMYGRIQAAVDYLKGQREVVGDKIAVIGYCFGGTGAITYSFLGASADVVATVSFHGGLTEFPVTESINHPVLVLSGGDDDTGTQVEDLENQLNEANATWQITRFSGIEHAFTQWDDRRYNKRADERSWSEMSSFLAEAFGMVKYGTISPNATEVTQVDYDDNGFSLTGYLAIPPGAEMGKTAAVVIVPDWDGVSGADGYEAHRATMLAEEGYVAVAADIFGSDKQQVEGFNERVTLVQEYHQNYTKFVSRIQAAVDLLKEHELVDPEKILMIGYCFGGTGVVDYAFSDVQDVKAVVPFHGGLTSTSPIETDVVYPYVLVQSGGIDDAHGNNTELEMSLDGANATWEITRYSGVVHGFTQWSSAGAYDPLADWRSWDAMLSVFDMILNGNEMSPESEIELSNSGEEEELESAAHRLGSGWAVVIAATVSLLWNAQW